MTRLERILDLIQTVGTADQFREFLGAHGVAASGPWEKLIGRVTRALDEGRFTDADLLDHLRDVEEFGRQHIFLLKRAGGVSAVPSKAALTKWLAANGATVVASQPRLIDQPDTPTICDARYELKNGVSSLVVKIVETRRYDELVDTKEISGERFQRTYQRKYQRAVSIVRMCSDGLLEIRIFSHANGSRSYENQLEMIWRQLLGLVDEKEFNRIALAKAKEKLYGARVSLASRIRFVGETLEGARGRSHEIASNRRESLFDDPSTEKTIAILTASGTFVPLAWSLYWLQQKDGKPPKDIHVMLRGALNEFSVSQSCSGHVYEIILHDILRHNS